MARLTIRELHGSKGEAKMISRDIKVPLFEFVQLNRARKLWPAEYEENLGLHACKTCGLIVEGSPDTCPVCDGPAPVNEAVTPEPLPREEELPETRNELEKQVRDLTRKLERTNKKLNQQVKARKMAERVLREGEKKHRKLTDELVASNRELEGFAHTVSHDLKGPLTGMLLGAEVLGRLLGQMGLVEDNKNIAQALDVIEKTIWRSTNLINELLALAEAGQEPVDISEVDVSEVVDSVLEENASACYEKGVMVVVSKDLGSVTASPTQIYQVFSNLVRNCIKYCDNKKPIISIERVGNGGRNHKFLVRDNGSGIPPEIVDHMFEPFFKGSNGGTGIGLATVEKIVTTYGGAIKAYNKEGACFEFTFKDYQVEERGNVIAISA